MSWPSSTSNDSAIPTPDVIVHSTSSGGTQAGLIAGCRIYGLPSRVLGISADESSAALGGDVRRILTGLEGLLGEQAGALASDETPHIDDEFVGEGSGSPTPASREALELLARTEAIVLDPTYTAKAMAGLIAYVRTARCRRGPRDPPVRHPRRHRRHRPHPGRPRFVLLARHPDDGERGDRGGGARARSPRRRRRGEARGPEGTPRLC